MATIELTASNYEQVTGQAGIVLVDAWAAWCGPCRQFGPVYESAAKRHSQHTFGKLDTEAEQQLTEQLSIEHIPTLLIYKDGHLVHQEEGALRPEILDELILQSWED